MSIYTGIAFPFRRGPQGFPQPAQDDELLWMSIRQLLLTGRGERVMRPDVGSQIERFVFEPNEDLRAELIAAEVMEVLSRYEPRILVTGVETITEDESVIVTIGYVVRATGQPQTQGVSIPVPPRE